MLYSMLKQSTRRDESFLLDCVQEAMLRIATKLQRIDSHRALDVWLKRVVLNAALDRLRAERSQLERMRHVPSRDAQIDEDPSEMLEQELARLPHDDRSLLHLRFARGLTLQQLSEHLGLAPRAIDSRIRRLIARVRGGPAPATEAAKEGNNP
jgi:RNA polymerase sigma-70 factor (ECF subfamily)